MCVCAYVCVGVSAQVCCGVCTHTHVLWDVCVCVCVCAVVCVYYGVCVCIFVHNYALV